MTLPVDLGLVKYAKSQRQYIIHEYIKHNLERY